MRPGWRLFEMWDSYRKRTFWGFHISISRVEKCYIIQIAALFKHCNFKCIFHDYCLSALWKRFIYSALSGHSFRCRTLFHLHNVRSAIQMILFLVQIFELAESYLAVGITITESISISPLQIPYAWLSFICTIGMITFIRVCEMYDKSGEKQIFLAHSMHRTIGWHVK